MCGKGLLLFLSSNFGPTNCQENSTWIHFLYASVSRRAPSTARECYVFFLFPLYPSSKIQLGVLLVYIHITNVFVFWAKYITLALKYLFIKSIFKTVIIWSTKSGLTFSIQNPLIGKYSCTTRFAFWAKRKSIKVHFAVMNAQTEVM